MPTALRTVIVVLLAALLGGCAQVTATGDPNLAATVDGGRVRVDDVESQLRVARTSPEVAAQLDEGDAEATRALHAQIVQSLILTELLVQGAEELGVGLDDMSVARAEFAEDFGGPAALEVQLSQQGLSLEDLDPQIRGQLLEGRVGAALAEEAGVTDADVEEAYDEQFSERPNVRHILLETEEEAEEVLAELEDGADFSALAAERSIDPGAEQNGGELGPLERGQTVPAFEEAAFEADEGEVVGPVETEFGFHVIEVTELIPGPEFEDVEDDLRQELATSGEVDVVQQWLMDRAEQADVVVNPRFGEWEPDSINVVPTPALDRTGPVTR